MGADLILEPLFTNNYVKYEPMFKHWVKVRDELRVKGDEAGADIAHKQVDMFYDKMYERGYFRDSYNGSCLLWKFDLSWWDDVDRRLTNWKGKMNCRKTHRFLRLLADREPVFEGNLRHLKVGKGESRDKVARIYRDRYAQLKGFLQEALDRRLAITCSL